MLLRALVVVRDPALGKRFQGMLAELGVIAESANTTAGVMTGGYDLMLLDEAAAGRAAKMSGAAPDERLPARIVLSTREDPATRAALLAQGVEAVLYCGLGDDALRGALQARIDQVQRLAALIDSHTRDTVPSLADFASESQPMRALVDIANKVKNSSASLLIQGETGVGKEWLAKAIHSDSDRGRGPFVAVNCAAIPEPLLESELFGHEAGAFTGALRARRGAFEMAHGGTIFLDEIGDMAPHLQVKLLRVLQDHCVQRVGAEQPINLDVRVMAASNRDLQVGVRAQTFRQDLYYRLSVVTLTAPPLRARRADIRPLAERYVQHFARRLGRPTAGIDERAIQLLIDYDWPGNIRELINVMERAVLLSSGPWVTIDDLSIGIGGSSAPIPPASGGSRPPPSTDTQWFRVPLARLRREMVDDLERRYLDAVLRDCRGQIGQTAAQAGIDTRALYNKMRKFGLRKESYRQFRE